MNIFKIYKLFEECPLTAIAHTVGRVKRDIGTIYVGFAYLNSPQQFEIATKLANPTQQEWLQSVGLTLLTIYRLGHEVDSPLVFFLWALCGLCERFSRQSQDNACFQPPSFLTSQPPSLSLSLPFSFDLSPFTFDLWAFSFYCFELNCLCASVANIFLWALTFQLWASIAFSFHSLHVWRLLLDLV